MKKSARRRIDVNLDELDRVLDGARQAPLSEADYEKVKDALHAMAAMLVRPRNTEKTSAVLDEAEASGKAATQPDTNAAPPAGHGRNGAEAFGGAQKVEIAHQSLKHGDRCPECGEGNVYGQKAEGTGADCRAGAASGHCLLARAVALRCVWAGVHRASA
jgi:hypothetical protein